MTGNKNDPHLTGRIAATEWHLPFEFEYEGQRVNYGVMGEGYPLVLLHGTPFSSVVWRRISPYLATHRKVYYFDLLGYGKSEKKDGQDVSLGVQNQLFAALLKYWEIKRPDVVAHDFGGATALRAHILNNADYRSLTLIDPVALSPFGSPFVQAVRNNEKVFSDLPAYIHQAIIKAYIGNSVVNELNDDVMSLYTEPWFGELGQSAFYRQVAQMSDQYIKEIEPGYAHMRCPVSILWGEKDEWIPKTEGEKLHKLISGSSLRLIDNSSHLMQEDAPEAIIATVLDFLNKIDIAEMQHEQL
ncbi:alpha/beta fold hydrolase [Mucilaginibacter polytrichastri]|uniref:AB hydrolase-1 domain-containing protein n=1 Tax=Mucilaginibacter polytrichastri TaxID=1302689 RepID=A0A1Q6A433_9SPHI|nr:alpha/beta hydrolase [Mucilaginibacter polytrichastri]OKS88757.1 hypothetical protein RG47T_4235 [Mucilaginibacter polytrichastri]SFT05303.1 Pimeloyl-ACP methyl ester carboxylesterase [Mucilaginibacter polytrichastri]